ncbi:hypothetical protein Efla_005585 [Eimeria flavescens]
MKFTNCALFVSAAAAAVFMDLRHQAAVASSWEDDEVELPEQVDAADLDEADAALGDLPSLSELAERERSKQKQMLEEEGAGEAEPKFDAEEEEFENLSEGELGEEQQAGPLKDEDLEDVDSQEDLQADATKPPQQEREEAPSAGSGESTAGEGAESSQGQKKYGGQVVQEEDEEGVRLDLSALNPEQEQGAPDIAEYVDAVPKFKKEEEEKKKRKEDFKKKKEENNDINFYEKEIAIFREAEEKNKNRFDEEVQNAEEGIREPKRPSWWKRMKHKFDVVVDPGRLSFRLLGAIGSGKKRLGPLLEEEAAEDWIPAAAFSHACRLALLKFEVTHTYQQ